MKFSRYGITLERLEEKHLPMTLSWRNQDFVRKNMHYKKLISWDDHRYWFAHLHDINDWYFVAQKKTSPIGVFHIKNIQWNRGCGEAGGFLAEETSLGNPDAALAIFALMDFAFFVLGLHSLEAKYSTQAQEIVKLNDQLGYIPENAESDGFIRARTTTERYLSKTNALRTPFLRNPVLTSMIVDPSPWLAQHYQKIKTGEFTCPIVFTNKISK